MLLIQYYIEQETSRFITHAAHSVSSRIASSTMTRYAKHMHSVMSPLASKFVLLNICFSGRILSVSCVKACINYLFFLYVTRSDCVCL